MDLLETLKKKKPYAYYLGENILVISGDTCNIIVDGYSYFRIDENKKILADTKEHTKEEIQKAIRCISSFSNLLAEKNEFTKKVLDLKDVTKTLDEDQLKQLEEEVKKFEVLYKENM